MPAPNFVDHESLAFTLPFRVDVRKLASYNRLINPHVAGSNGSHVAGTFVFLFRSSGQEELWNTISKGRLLGAN